MKSKYPDISLNGIAHTEKFDFSKNTTYGLGGQCKAAFFPTTEEEAVYTFNKLSESNEKFFVLGKGSNILASEKFFDGYIISTSQLKGIYYSGGNLVCLSGTAVSEMLNFCKNHGLSGLEFLAGIPASIGGLTFMNGGAGGKYISDIFESAAVYDGKIRYFSKDSCNFGYKYSTMRDIKCVILSVSLKITPASKKEVGKNIDRYLKLRSKQPKGKSCGCVFKNPQGVSAGKLIDYCGLKGFQLGGARVSDIHANFILNAGGTSLDVYNLIRFVKDSVYDKFGVVLEEEVVYIGDFNDSFG